MHNPMHDALVVGGGPAGLSAALFLARACRRIALVDAGQPRNRAAQRLHGFLGRDNTPPLDLLRDARRDLARYDVRVISDEVVAARRLDCTSNDCVPTAFAITTAGGVTFAGRKLLLATGTRDELPDLPGLRDCYGKSVHHCPYCDGWEHRGQHLLAYGDSAAHAIGLALTLRGWSERVTALTHGEPISSSDRSRLEASGAALREDAIVRLVHEAGRLTSIELAGGVLAADALFFNTGQQKQANLSQMLGCEPAEEPFVKSRDKQRTNVPGLFLAGDADGDVQFAIVAAGEGATAAVAINHELLAEEQAARS